MRNVTRYIRYRTTSSSNTTPGTYGILDGDTVREIRGDLFGSHEPTGVTHPLSSVTLLHPCNPTKILCVGLNYKSHLGGRPQPTRPEIFYKPLSAVQDPGGPIVTPRDATDLHYEGELVAVVGKTVRNVSANEAVSAIFGVTCGNDVSERNWQHGGGKDLQWWRAKGSDTFAPFGPAIAVGADYGNLQLTTRLNGEVVQQQYTSDLIFNCAAIVSWISGWITLNPGDIIYTGTPGSTRKISPGDVVQVELEGVGVLENPVA
jgi:2-keto-4-pentenoate hydratase/2-oxohepta-3-ene-1,7-dioic acid hydratase in catechol pathway